MFFLHVWRGSERANKFSLGQMCMHMAAGSMRTATQKYVVMDKHGRELICPYCVM